MGYTVEVGDSVARDLSKCQTKYNYGEIVSVSDMKLRSVHTDARTFRSTWTARAIGNRLSLPQFPSPKSRSLLQGYSLPPLTSEYGTYEKVKARFWPLLSGERS